MKPLKNKMLPFFAVMFIFNMAANFVHPVTPTIISDLNLSDYMFGLAFSAMMAFNFLFSPLWGKMAGYISSKKVMLISGIGYAVGQVFFGIAKTEIHFLLARMFAGAFCGGAYVSFLTYTVNASSVEARNKNIALNAILTAVSSSFGYFVGGMIGEIGAYISVWVQIATLVISSCVLYFVCVDDTRGSNKRPSGKKLIKECNPFSAIWQCRHFMTRAIIFLFLSYGFLNIGFTAFEQCFNYYLRDQLGLTSGYNGVIKAILGFISLIANGTLCLWIMKQRRASRYLALIIALCAFTTIGAIVFSAPIPFIISNVLFYAFYYISLPLSQSSAAYHGQGKDSNLVMGSFNAVKSFGSIFGSALAGFMYEFHVKLPFIFGFATFIIATIAIIAFVKADERDFEKISKNS
ncbi:MAG: MFS transporter [Clostridia bacterium]|nr:MFS transporter [Clostridia bacterium]